MDASLPVMLSAARCQSGAGTPSKPPSILADAVSPRRTALHRAAFGPSDEPPLPDPLPEPELEPELDPLPLPEPELPELPELLELLLDELLNEELLLLLLAGAELDELLELLELDCEALESL